MGPPTPLPFAPMRPTVSLCLSVLLLAGCGDRPVDERVPPDDSLVTAAIFEGLPVMPGSRLGGRSSDAAEAIVNVPVSADSVATYYRNALADRDWDLRGDATTPDGRISLHARSAEGRPIWIIIEPTGVDRAKVSVIAAAPDSVPARR